MSIERRLNPRAVVDLPAELRGAGGSEWEKVCLHDLSAGGAAIHTPLALALQSEVRIRFRLPEGPDEHPKQIEALCLVVRKGEPARRDPGRPFLAGLHFLDLRGEEYEAVRRFVWNRLHDESDDED